MKRMGIAPPRNPDTDKAKAKMRAIKHDYEHRNMITSPALIADQFGCQHDTPDRSSLSCEICGEPYRFGADFLFDGASGLIYCRDCASDLLAGDQP